jgi:hypothetical protein
MEITVTVDLTAAEASHLLSLLRDAEIEGCYYGNREQYWIRHGAITQKIAAELPEPHDAASSDAKEGK